MNWDAHDALRALGQGAAAANRFTGEAGALLELFAGDPVRHIVLLGVGGGDEPDWEKAGGALTARFLASGVAEVALGAALLAVAVVQFQKVE